MTFGTVELRYMLHILYIEGLYCMFVLFEKAWREASQPASHTASNIRTSQPTLAGRKRCGGLSKVYILIIIFSAEGSVQFVSCIAVESFHRCVNQSIVGWLLLPSRSLQHIRFYAICIISDVGRYFDRDYNNNSIRGLIGTWVSLSQVLL